MTFKWYRNSVAIGGATNSSYFIASAGTNNAGVYKVDVKNTSGTTVSSNAMFTVQLAPVPINLNVTTAEDTAINIVLTATNVDNPPIVYAILTGPTNGVLGPLDPNSGAVTYSPATNYNGSDSFTFTAFDGSLSATGRMSITITPVNDGPVVSVPAAQTATEDVALVFSLANGNSVSISDPDAGTNLIQLTLSVTNGAATLSRTNGLTFTAGDGTSDASMTFRGNLTNLNAALNGLVLAPSTNYNGGATLNIGALDGLLATLNSEAALKGRYTFDDPTALGNDTSPAGANAGTVTGATAAVDATHGNVLSLDTAAGADYVRIAGHFGNPANVTLAAWVNLTAAPIGGSEVISLGDSAALRLDDNGALKGYFYDGTTWKNTAYTIILAGAGWHHVAYTFDANAHVQALFLDGVAVASAAFSGSIKYTLGANSFIGTHGNGSTLHDFTGQIGDARIYSRALASNEIVTIAADLTLRSAGSVAITIAPVNDAPAASNDSYTTQEDVPLSVPAPGILANDVDVEGDPMIALLVSNVTHGSLGLNPDGSFTYTPAANYAGSDSFTYQASDGLAAGNVATVTLNVTPVNDAPVAINQSVTVPEDMATNIVLTATDVDSSGLTYSILIGPANGTLGVLNTNTGAVTYRPATNYNGGDIFTFRVSDGSLSATGLVAITVTPVNDPPVASNQFVTVLENTSIDLALMAADVDSSTLTYSILAAPTNGAIYSVVGNVAAYSPAVDFYGRDSFTFIASDGYLYSTGRVYLTITVPGTPAASMWFSTAGAATAGGTNWAAGEIVQFGGAGDYFTAPAVTTAGSVAKLPGFVAPAPVRALHYVQAILTIGTTGPRFTLYPGDLVMALDTGNGSVTLNSNPTNQFTATRQDIVVYRPNIAENYSIGTWFMLLNKGVHDGATIYNVHEVSIVETPTTVGGTTLAAGTFVVAHSGGTLDMNVYTVTASGTGAGSGTQTTDCTPLLLGASLGNPSGQIKGLTVLSYPTAFNDNVLPAGTLLVAVNGTNSSFAGVAQDSFDVVALQVTRTQQDPLPGSSASGTILFDGSDVGLTNTAVAKNINSLTIRSVPVSGFPFAFHQTLVGAEDTALPIALTSSDLDGPITNFTVMTLPAHGTLTGSAPNLVFQPATNYFGADSFTFVVDDGSLTSAEATVSITITPVNDPPSAFSQSLTNAEDTVLPIYLGSFDVDGPVTNYTIVMPLHGTLSGSGASRTYLPSTNYFGPDSFTFRVNDGSLTSAVATVTITVTPVNDAPVALNQSRTAVEDTALSITLTGSDVDGPVTNFTVATLPAHGTLSGTAPNLVYQPAINYNGPDSFTFSVNDGLLTSALGTVSITVTAVNDGPAAINQIVTILEDTATNLVLSATDVDSPNLVYAILAVPTNGVLGVLSTNTGAVTYRPTTNYNGGDSFTFRVSDGSLFSTGRVTITVTPVNDVPVANNQSVTTPDSTAKLIGLTASDVEGDPLTFSIVTPPAHGIISLFNTANGAMTYIPTTGYTGPDSFSFRVIDGFASSVPATVSITVTPAPPGIATPPQSQTVMRGQATSFSVGATGTAPLSYRWLFNGATLSGATSAALNLVNVQAANAGNYAVVVSNVAGSVTSAAATLTVNIPAGIATQPNSQTVGIGQNASFSVGASGSPPFSYQWRFNGTNLAGANGATLTLSGVQAANAGSYDVVVTNPFGSATSSAAVLLVKSGWFRVVVNTSDSGAGSLRQAMLDVNSFASQSSGPHTITFNILGVPPFTIAPLIALPIVTNSVVIDGADQPGYTGQPIIELNGNNLLAEGLHLSGGDSAVRGLVINRFLSAGISLDTGANNVIEGNYIGTDVTGTTALANGTGIGIGDGADFTRIGGTSAGAGNLISGNIGYGLFINGGHSNLIQGNLLGVDVSGTNALGNGSVAVRIQNSDGTLIGGTAPGAGNVIAANGFEGIRTFGANTPYLTIQGNFIGTDRSGTLNLGNFGDGVGIRGSAPNMLVGGRQPGAGNIIAFNGGSGVTVTAGQVAILGNSIYSNLVGGIANGYTYYPLLTSATNDLTTTVIAGTLSPFAAFQTYRIEFFASPTCDISGFGEGKTFLGAADVTTDAGGNADFSVSLNTGDISGQVITATATSPDDFTSSFSACQPLVLIRPPTILSQPASQEAAVGANATFAVGANGDASLSYQWYFNGVPLEGATGTSWSVNNVQAPALGNYTVVISNRWGSLTSAVATLTFPVPPGIATQPQSQILAAGQNARFSVTATGSAPFSYQWRFNDVPLPGANGSTLTLNEVLMTNAGNYSVIVSNAVGWASSTAATLTVTNPPTFVKIDGYSCNTTNEFNLQLSVSVGSTYIIWASANCRDWTPIGTNFASTTHVTFTDSAAASFPKRFYRASAK